MKESPAAALHPLALAISLLEHAMSIDDALTERIIGCAYQVANTLGPGFLEKVYENALAHELRKAGLSVIQQQGIEVRYDGIVVGDFIADLIVEGTVILELKATREHSDFYTAQCLNHLKATGKPTCLLINFGRAKIDIKRFWNPDLQATAES
jgi:GxxExxY protein